MEVAGALRYSWRPLQSGGHNPAVTSVGSQRCHDPAKVTSRYPPRRMRCNPKESSRVSWLPHDPAKVGAGSQQSPRHREDTTTWGRHRIVTASTTLRIHNPAELPQRPTVPVLIPVLGCERNDKFCPYHPTRYEILNYDLGNIFTYFQNTKITLIYE